MGGSGFAWSDFGSQEQPEGHVKPNPDGPGPSYGIRHTQAC
nr:cation diffusion facilitator family transporter [Kroppenstedtia eburnea]